MRLRDFLKLKEGATVTLKNGKTVVLGNTPWEAKGDLGSLGFAAGTRSDGQWVEVIHTEVKAR